MQNPETSTQFTQENQDQEIVATTRDLERLSLGSSEPKTIKNSDDDHLQRNSCLGIRDSRVFIEERLPKLAKDFIANLQNDDIKRLETTAEEIRKIISERENPPVDPLIQAGIVPFIIDLLGEQKFDSTKLINECSWILVNIASSSSDEIQNLISLRIISIGFRLLFHPHEQVKDNIVFLFANIAGDSLENRDLLLQCGIVEKIFTLLDGGTFKPQYLENVSWLIFNLCREPCPQRNMILPLLQIAGCLFKTIKGENTIRYILYTLSSFSSDDDEEGIQEVFSLGVMDKIVEALQSQNKNITIPALETVSNLSMTDDPHSVQLLIYHGLLPSLSTLLQSKETILRKQAYYTLSKFISNKGLIEEIFKFHQAEIFKRLFEAIFNDDLQFAKDAFYCLTRVCFEGSFEQVCQLVDLGLIPLLTGVIRINPDEEELVCSLQTIINILVLAKEEGKDNTFLEPLLQLGIIGILKDLEHNPIPGVDEKIKDLKNYIEY